MSLMTGMAEDVVKGVVGERRRFYGIAKPLWRESHTVLCIHSVLHCVAHSIVNCRSDSSLFPPALSSILCRRDGLMDDRI